MFSAKKDDDRNDVTSADNAFNKPRKSLGDQFMEKIKQQEAEEELRKQNKA